MKKWRRKDIILFLERLEMYMRAGLSLDKALVIGAEGLNKKHAAALAHVLRDVQSGGALSKALARSIGLKETSEGLVSHGESSGELAGALAVSRSLLEREDDLLKKCTSAMAYPVVIGVFALALTLGLVRGVMPQIIPMLVSLHVTLPLLTRCVMSISALLMRYGLAAAGAGMLAAVCMLLLYKKAFRFRYFAHWAILRIPLIGTLFSRYHLSVFLRSCGSLLESGVSVKSAYPGTVATVSLLPLKRRLQLRSIEVGHGMQVSSIFRAAFAPSYVGPLIGAGEMSGTLGTSMQRSALIIDREIEHSLKRITSLIEPVMMVGMGLVVGSIALSIMMPIYDISRVLQH